MVYRDHSSAEIVTEAAVQISPVMSRDGSKYDAEQAAPLMSKQIPDINFIPPTAQPNETPPQWNLPGESGAPVVQYQPQSTVVMVNPQQVKAYKAIFEIGKITQTRAA